MTDLDTIYQKKQAIDSWTIQNHFSLPNRAMNFGDGLFETMVSKNGSIQFLEHHLSRLMEGMHILKLNFTQIDVEDLVALIKADFPEGDFRLRWNVFRSGSGKYTPASNLISQSIEVLPFQPAPLVKKLAGISKEVKLFPTPWANCKTLNALPYILANQERVDHDWDEIILLDNRGFVSEAGASNIFWLSENIIYTPSLSCSCINGVSRRVIIQRLAEKKITLVEGEFQIGSMIGADSLVVSNATGISSLSQLDGNNYSTDLQSILTKLFY